MGKRFPSLRPNSCCPRQMNYCALGIAEHLFGLPNSIGCQAVDLRGLFIGRLPPGLSPVLGAEVGPMVQLPGGPNSIAVARASRQPGLLDPGHEPSDPPDGGGTKS